MKKHLSTIILVTALIVGGALIVYPSASDYWNSLHQSKAIANYIKSVSDTGEARRKAMLDDAEAYNQKLGVSSLNFFLNDDESKRYKDLLNVDGSGIMGYLDISVIGCHLPIYHGVDDTVLQIAVGHIPGSSLPIGGESTHCVLSGHRGLPSAKIFSQLNRMCEGDTFVIHILNEAYTYEVDSILTVVPDDISALKVVPGADLCTLVTCTPYGVNTHRLLVTGHRITNALSQTAHINSEALILRNALSVSLFAAPIAIICFIILFITTDINSKRATLRNRLGITSYSSRARRFRL